MSNFDFIVTQDSTPPTITTVRPSDTAVIRPASIFSFQFTDDAGVVTGSLSVRIDGDLYAYTGSAFSGSSIQWTEIDNGYSLELTLTSDVAVGLHFVTASIADVFALSTTSSYFFTASTLFANSDLIPIEQREQGGSFNINNSGRDVVSYRPVSSLKAIRSLDGVIRSTRTGIPSKVRG